MVIFFALVSGIYIDSLYRILLVQLFHKRYKGFVSARILYLRFIGFHTSILCQTPALVQSFVLSRGLYFLGAASFRETAPSYFIQRIS